MATRTTTTKAKTKTAKAKTTTAKATTKKAPETAVKNSTKAGMLPKIYGISIAVYIAIAGAAYALMSSASYNLTVGYWAKDELASTKETVFAPATQIIYAIELRWIVVAVALISLVMPVLYLTRLKKYNAESLKNKVLPTRWFEMAVVSAILLETAGIISGVLDIGTLKLIGGLMVVTCILGWMAEKRTAEAGKPATAKYYLSMFTGLLPWVVIAIYAVSTIVYGEVRATWFVYATYAVLLIAGGLIGTHQLNSLKGIKTGKTYELAERNYAVLSLLTRTAFAAVLIIGVLAK